MSKKDNKKRLEEIHNRLDDKAKILYMAYKNGRLDLDKLNDDMKERILKLKKGDKSNSKVDILIKKLKSEKIKEINKAIDNLDNSYKDDDIEEKDEEPELYEKLITKFNYFKVI